jgi:GNAT superfamily N-acetyltransferase
MILGLTNELLVIALLPEHEGKDIGGRLMQVTDEWLAESGCIDVWLTTDEDQSRRAYGFYRYRAGVDWKIECGLRFMRKVVKESI